MRHQRQSESLGRASRSSEPLLTNINIAKSLRKTHHITQKTKTETCKTQARKTTKCHNETNRTHIIMHNQQQTHQTTKNISAHIHRHGDTHT